ncbi:MAG: polysaccharide deacetylase WbmS family protein, partial [Gemmatimonadales bacterium]
LQPGIRAYPLGHELTEVPLFWMDAFHLEYCELGRQSALELPAPALAQPGLKVLAVHPVHLVLNTESQEHYVRAKAVYHDPAGLRRERCNGRGVRDLFLEMVRTLEALQYEFVLIRDAAG